MEFNRKLMQNTKLKRVVLYISLLLAIVSAFQGCKNAMTKPGSFDFQYDAAKYIRLRLDPYSESLHPTGMQEKLDLYNTYGEVEANQFPSLLLLLLPFTFFPPKVANFLWMVSNLIMTGWILYFIYKEICNHKIDFQTYLIICFLFLFSCPWRNHIGVGQHTIFSLFFFLVSVKMTKKNHRYLSGIFLACSYFKYTLTVPLALYFIYKRRYKEIFISIIPHIICTIGASIWLNVSIPYLIICPLKIATRFSSIGSINLSSLIQMGKFSLIISLFLCLLMFIVSLLERDRFLEWEFISILIMFSLIVVYHRTYDAFILIIPLMVVLTNYMENRQRYTLSFTNLSVCVFCLFYLDRIMVLLPENIYECYMKVLAILFYFTFVLCWSAFRKVKNTNNNPKYINE